MHEYLSPFYLCIFSTFYTLYFTFARYKFLLYLLPLFIVYEFRLDTDEDFRV